VLFTLPLNMLLYLPNPTSRRLCQKKIPHGREPRSELRLGNGWQSQSIQSSKGLLNLRWPPEGLPTSLMKSLLHQSLLHPPWSSKAQPPSHHQLPQSLMLVPVSKSRDSWTISSGKSRLALRACPPSNTEANLLQLQNPPLVVDFLLYARSSNV
jgi:hypothetical protein